VGGIECGFQCGLVSKNRKVSPQRHLCGLFGSRFATPDARGETAHSACTTVCRPAGSKSHRVIYDSRNYLERELLKCQCDRVSACGTLLMSDPDTGSLDTSLAQMPDSGPGTADFELRPALPEDEAFLYELYCSTRVDEIAAFGWDRSQQDAFLQLQFRGQKRHYQVQQLDVDSRIIVKAGQAIGQIIVLRSGQEIRLADIALLPEYRGAGIGSGLIGDLCSEARESGRPVTLHVEKSSRAVALYERLGFVKTSEMGFHYRMEWRAGALEG